MNGTPTDAALERLLDERGPQLMRVAIALAGGRDAGQDLLQAALERVLRKPRQVDADTEGYLRQVLYNLAADGWRRRGRWRQRLPLLRAQALSCGLFPPERAAVGRRRGRDDPGLPAAGRGVPRNVLGRSLDLPAVRMSAAFLSGSARGQQFVTDYRFLPPTRANLAALHAAERRAPIPATFRLLPQQYTVLSGGV
jgi:hypothetical protein